MRLFLFVRASECLARGFAGEPAVCQFPEAGVLPAFGMLAT